MSERSAALRLMAASLRALVTAGPIGIFQVVAAKQLIEPGTESPDRRDKRAAAAALDDELEAAKRLYRQARRRR